MTELHAIDCPALAHRAQRGRVAEHFREGNARRHHMRVGPLRHAADFAAPARQVADHLAHVIGWRDDLDVHDRLEQDRVRLARGFLDRQAAFLQRFLPALLHRPDVLPGDYAADDVVLEYEPGPRLAGGEVDHDVAVLATAAGLADELALHILDALAYRFAVGHLRPAHVGVDLELTAHAFDDDLQV